MLRYTEEQKQYILNLRRQWDAHQIEMAKRHGLPVPNKALRSMSDWQNPNAIKLVGNASPLPRDVWGEWDREGIEIQRDVLSVFDDLSASVARPIPIGKVVHHFQQVSDSGETNISLDGRSRARLDHPVISYVGTPIPIVDSPWGFGWRQVAAAQSEGMSLDPAASNNATRKVAEKLESIALDGDSSIVVGGSTLTGLRNASNVNTRNTTNDLSSATGTEWEDDVRATLKLLHNDNYRVPATLYVNWDDWFYATSTQYSTSYAADTIASKIRQMEGVAEVVPASDVAADEIIAVVKRREVVQVLNAMPPMTRAMFRANPEDDYNFLRMAAAAVEVKHDADGRCGVAYSS